MEDYIGKICPFCKTEIKEGEAVKVCPACGIPHHEFCWNENKGCTTFGCSEQMHEELHTNPTEVCAKCGAPLGDGQEFCPKCGTPKTKKLFCAKCGAELQDGQAFCPKCGTPAGAENKQFCSKCGTELAEGQAFCPKCGQRADVRLDAGVNAAVSQFNAGVTKSNEQKKKLPLIIGIAAGVVVLGIVLALLLGGGGKKSFSKMYGDLTVNSWCTIASDGSYMKLDTNPTDKDSDDFTYTDYVLFSEANDAIERINKELGFSDALMEKMNTTTWSQGKQTDSNDKYIVTWTYHPDKGLEVLYEFKK